MISGVFRSTRLVLFGRGQRRAAGRLASQLGRKAFVCADGHVHQDPMLGAIVDSLKAAAMDTLTYSGTVAELPLACVEEAVEQTRAFKPDPIVGLGGGSCLDLARSSRSG